MKRLVKTPKTRITRYDDISNTIIHLQCVIDSNPLSDYELAIMENARNLLIKEKMWMRDDTEFNKEEIEASMI